jgi:hypothetical protein
VTPISDNVWDGNRVVELPMEYPSNPCAKPALHGTFRRCRVHVQVKSNAWGESCRRFYDSCLAMKVRTLQNTP